ncbi:MAG: antitermination protein NusG [Oscillospiraceae bacterium]|jgi:transcriptional antiterminator NusG|nr:antitermination protein NusG [Oscillospiraceae bacterium]
MNYKWYALKVITGKELAVRDALEQLRIRAAVPQEERLIRSKGEWNTKLYTLFVGYVFVYIAYNADNYYAIRAVNHVLDFLRYGAEPVPLTYLEAEWIRQLAGNGQPLKPSVIRLDGEGNIREINGVLEHFAARIIKYDKHARKAHIEVSIGPEKKELQLSAVLDEDNDAEAGDEPSEEDEDTG